MKTLKIGLFFMILLVLTSCENRKDIEVEEETARIANLLEEYAVTSRENSLRREKVIVDAYENKERYDLSVDDLDVKNGGVYDWFEDYIYYPINDVFDGKAMINLLVCNEGMYIDPEKYEYKPENFDKAIKLTPESPEFITVQKEIKLWNLIVMDVLNAGKDHGYSKFMYWCNPALWLQAFSFHFDYISSVNADWTQEILGNAEWCKDGSWGNLDKELRWGKKAFTGFAGEGWIISHSKPMYANGKYIGFINNNLYPLEFVNKHIAKNEYSIILIDPNTALMGTSSSAKDLFKLEELEDFDYLKQMKENTFVEEELYLNHESQESYTNEMANRVLNGDKQFEIDIEGTKYITFVKDISEIDFYVIGLSKK